MLHRFHYPPFVNMVRSPWSSHGASSDEAAGVVRAQLAFEVAMTGSEARLRLNAAQGRRWLSSQQGSGG